ncbi:MAG: NAD-dependent epimerase/dehydratase family protein [Chitinophagales bacterium]
MNFVTGATGLLGSHLVRLLLGKGEKVRALRRSTSSLQMLEDVKDRVEWVEGDILDISCLLDAFKDVHTVYHCAAVISFLPEEVEYMLKINVEGTANVMNAALSCGIKKMVYVSSTAALGLAKPGTVIDEKYSDPNINKAPWYYRSKQYGEREAWRANAEGLDVVVACPSAIIGTGSWNQEPGSLFRDIYKGLTFYTTATNGFIDVDDVSACLYFLAKGNFNGEKFILSAENLSFRDLMAMIADSLNVKRPALKANGFLMGLAWRAEVLRYGIGKLLGVKPARPIVTKESAWMGSTDFCYTNEKIKDAMGITFKPIQNSVKQTAGAYLKSIG